MPTPKEITATEKLLDLIRASAPPPVAEGPAEPAVAQQRPTLTLEENDREEEVVPGAEGMLISLIDPSAPGPDAPPLATVIDPGDDRPSPPSLLTPPRTVKAPSRFQTGVAAIRRNLSRLQPLTTTTIAVDIQPGMIHLVKTLASTEGHELLECQSLPYEHEPGAKPENLFEDQTFRAVLFRALSAIIPKQGRYEIWCSYSYCNPVALHNISIPKVAEKEIANAVFWSAKRELEFDDSTLIFDYSVLQELNEGGQAKIQTLVTLVPRHEVEGVATMFKDAGFPLTGLTFPAAATQNFLNQDRSIPADAPVAYFTIRKNSSFIDLFYQGKMFFSREIKTGADSFVESLLDHALSLNILIDEQNAKEYLFRPLDRVSNPKLDNDEISSQLQFDSLAVIERLARQLVRTFEYCGAAFKTPAVNTIFTSGEFTVNQEILQTIENRVGIKCVVIEPLSPKIFKQTSRVPAATTATLLVAAGLSLSKRESTANFLFTYADRFAEAASNRINTVIAVVTICLALGCGGFFAAQYHQGTAKRATIATLTAELDRKYQAEPRSNSSDYATQTIQKIRQFHHGNLEKVKRFKVIALISEVMQGLGQEITLTDLTLDLVQSPTEPGIKKEAATPQVEPAAGTMKLSGYISAPPEAQEFILMNFLKNLAQLTLLGEPKLQAKEKASLQGQDVLRFDVNLKTTLTLLESAAP